MMNLWKQKTLETKSIYEPTLFCLLQIFVIFESETSGPRQ